MTESFKENDPHPGRGVPDEPTGKERRGRVGRYFLRFFNVIIALGLAVAVFVGYHAWTFMNTVPQTEGQAVIINIEPGASFGAVARTLQDKGVVTSAAKFKFLARLQKKDQSMQAGRFLMRPTWTPQTVLDEMVSGRALLHRVTVPEGKPWWEVAAILERNGMCRAEDFTAVIHDQEFLGHWGIPFANAEGFLYPDTYFLLQPGQMDMQAARSMANRMVETFWRKGDEIWQDGRPNAQNLRRIVILASIIEKETGVGMERARVAGVYTNRLKKNMLLQADPTVIYGLGANFSGQLLRRHLENTENPYNTYRRAGLPPGPICSPGAAALRAAVSPEEHDFLYFVATGRDKGHVFSKTLAEHNRAVRQYRQALRERGLR